MQKRLKPTMNSTQMARRIKHHVRDSDRTRLLFSFDRREQKEAITTFKSDVMPFIYSNMMQCNLHMESTSRAISNLRTQYQTNDWINEAKKLNYKSVSKQNK